MVRGLHGNGDLEGKWLGPGSWRGPISHMAHAAAV